MINSYADYQRYLEADRLALGKADTFIERLKDEVWAFQRALRKVEYLTNCKANRFRRLLARYRYRTLGIRLGFTIPINVCGPGLSIAHMGTIVISNAAKIGANCRIHVCVNVGTQAGSSDQAPTIGDNCYLGPGAKLFGKITIGPNTMIGANAVVNKSFPDGNVTLGGIPAKIISLKHSPAVREKLAIAA